MTTEELKTLQSNLSREGEFTIPLLLSEIAIQLSRFTDLAEEQWEYDKAKDADDAKHRDDRDDVLVQMKDIVKTGITNVNPTPVSKMPYTKGGL